MTLHIRPAKPFDAAVMAALLNEIIAIGGSTAMTRPVTAEDLRQWMAEPGSIWHLAENDKGAVQGFQWVHRRADLPPDTNILLLPLMFFTVYRPLLQGTHPPLLPGFEIIVEDDGFDGPVVVSGAVGIQP
mgnify:CR=1 FL=1